MLIQFTPNQPIFILSFRFFFLAVLLLWEVSCDLWWKSSSKWVMRSHEHSQNSTKCTIEPVDTVGFRTNERIQSNAINSKKKNIRKYLLTICQRVVVRVRVRVTLLSDCELRIPRHLLMKKLSNFWKILIHFYVRLDEFERI